MRGLLLLAPAALALQPMKPVSYDAFELAAAEALKDELRANYQKRAARERSMAAQAADALDAAQTLDQIEAALPLADAAGLPADAPEVLAAVARRDRARAAEERNAVAMRRPKSTRRWRGGSAVRHSRLASVLNRRVDGVTHGSRTQVLEEINRAADCDVESCDVELLAGLLDEARSLGVDASTIEQKGRELAAVQGDRAANVAAALIFSDEAHAIYDPLAPPRKEQSSFMEDISVLGPDL